MPALSKLQPIFMYPLAKLPSSPAISLSLWELHHHWSLLLHASTENALYLLDRQSLV